MRMIDPEAMKGKRVFVETDKDEMYVGTLSELREYAFELSEYFKVHNHNGKKITARSDFGSYIKIIMHSGGSKELKSIVLNTLEGDPIADKDDDADDEDPYDEDVPDWLKHIGEASHETLGFGPALGPSRCEKSTPALPSPGPDWVRLPNGGGWVKKELVDRAPPPPPNAPIDRPKKTGL